MLLMKAGVLGSLCFVVGVAMLVVEAKHGLTGEKASALLVDRVEECQVEFQVNGEGRKKEAMSCEMALSLRAMVGANKIRVHKTVFAVLRLPMADGSQRTVKVNQGVLEAYMVPTGSSVPVVYNPSNPDDVRPAMTFARVQHYLELVGLGLLLLVIAFIGPILRGVLGAFSGKEISSADQAAPELTPGQLALLQARDAQSKQAGAAAQLRSTRGSGTRVAVAGGMRHQFGMKS
jgi:hypothetical protein